ncbi:MAG: Panacea domain-containing protein [Anaerolineaceae bacterium]
MAVRFTFQEQKTTEAASILIQLQGGKMSYLKLLKLLYIADRIAIQEWERPITYDSYVSMNYGPVLSTTFDLIKGNSTRSSYWQEHICRQSRYELRLTDVPIKIQKLSRAEVELLHRVNDLYGEFEPFKLSKFTHSLPEFKNPHGTSIPISFEDILSGIGYNKSEIERVNSEINEESSILAIFGG